MSSFDLINYIRSTQIIQGSPESTLGKPLTDGRLEDYGDYAKKSRKEINYHLFNGTTISALSEAHADMTIGKKVNIQIRTDDTEINKQAEELLAEHSLAENFSVDKFYSRDRAFWNIENFKFLNGGVIIRFHYNTTWKIPIKTELVGIDMIDTSKTYKNYGIKNGLKKNRYGEITAIYLFDDEGKTTSSLYSTDDMVIYMTRWMSLSQRTAVSRLATILQDYDKLEIYNREEVKAAIERAKTGVYWHTELFAELQEALSLQLKSFGADERVLEAKDLINTLSRRGIGSAGATATPKDDSITQVDTKTQSVYEAFANQGDKRLSSSVGMSQTAAFKDPTKGNYSSLKLMVSYDDNHFQRVFGEFADTPVQQYLERLFRVGVQIGKIKISKVKYFNNPIKFHKWDVLRTVKINIDESKEATAIDKRLKNGTTTKLKVYAKDGLDFFEEMEKQADVDIQVELMRKKKFEEAGLEYQEEEIESKKKDKKKKDKKKKDKKKKDTKDGDKK